MYSIILKWLLVVQVDKNGAGEGVFSVGVNADLPCVAKGRSSRRDARIPGDLAPGSTPWRGQERRLACRRSAGSASERSQCESAVGYWDLCENNLQMFYL